MSRRDGAHDGRFVYAVRTTGVYCRPSCPSRRPRRENVEYFPTPRDAEAQGYRACKRCGPRVVGAATRYAIARASIGHVLVAATDRGVTAVLLGDSPAAVEAELRRELPRARLVRDDASLEEWLGAVVSHADGLRASPGVPTDLAGTDFQRLVWRALQAIPYGSTRSYREVAEALGRPTAVRAVARACATNRAALVVPCHRVVREDGAPSGFRWGVERKRRLLDIERRITAHRDRAGDDQR